MGTVSTTKSIYLWQLLKVYTFLIIKDWAVVGLLLLRLLGFLFYCWRCVVYFRRVWNPNRNLTAWMM